MNEESITRKTSETAQVEAQGHVTTTSGSKEIQDAIKKHLETNGKKNIPKSVAQPKLF